MPHPASVVLVRDVLVGGTKPIAVVFGTRPELVKLAGIIRLLGERAYTVHTGQHFDAAMAAEVLIDLGIGSPTVQLDVGGRSRGQQIGAATERLDELFAEIDPAAVIVQGDTNATVGGALAANARGLPLVHVEAGLRSRDRAMPEEHNRVIADHLADLCLTPTATTRANLLLEGIDERRIVVTGNTVVDAVVDLLPNAEVRSKLLARHGIDESAYVLATLHRPENVDDRTRLAGILEQLGDLSLPVLFPMHPRTSARVDEFGFRANLGNLRVSEPLPYGEFLSLLADCALAISDSGGVVEEASVVKRPVIVVRRSTERPEVLGTFATLTAPDGITPAARALLANVPAVRRRLAAVPSPYGDGDASLRSVDAITRLLERNTALGT